MTINLWQLEKGLRTVPRKILVVEGIVDFKDGEDTQVFPVYHPFFLPDAHPYPLPHSPTPVAGMTNQLKLSISG